jgi:hypothetical protein
VSTGYPQPCQQKVGISSSRDAQGLQTSVPFEFINLVVGTRPPVVRIIGTRRAFCGKYRSETISEGPILKLSAAVAAAARTGTATPEQVAAVHATLGRGTERSQAGRAGGG